MPDSRRRSFRWRSVEIPVFLLFLLILHAVTGCDPPPSVTIADPDGTLRAKVFVEIADTNDKREVGLMYRNHMDADRGMLFIFPQPEPAQFWMKNTEIPLDMIFADSKAKVVGVVANAEPYSEKLLGPFANTLYVLEVNAGFAKSHGIGDGDQMKFDDVPTHGQ